MLDVLSVRQLSERDFVSADLARDFVGDVTGKRGFLIVGDFFGDPEDSRLVVDFAFREVYELDFEGEGVGSLAFSGELELRLGCLLLGFDFNGSEEVERSILSRSLKNLGKVGFFAAPLEKLTSQAKAS